PPEGREGGERIPHRECPVLVVVVLGGEGDLLEIVRALRPPSRLAGGLDGGQEQRDQDGDDRDHHPQLDPCEAAGSGFRSAPTHGGSFGWRQVVGGGSGGELPGPVVPATVAGAARDQWGLAGDFAFDSPFFSISCIRFWRAAISGTFDIVPPSTWLG